MPDLAVRLSEALHHAELAARAGGPGPLDAAAVLRLAARDRATLTRHRLVYGEGVCACCRGLWPCPDLRAAAEFWIKETS